MQIVIGVDSGGSKTRALAVRLDGVVVGYCESGGGNPSHAAAFHENIQGAIKGAAAGFAPGSVAVIVSGIAGLDNPSDHEWAAKATDVFGPGVNRLQINDADIALYGALEGRPGIMCIQGEGSMILAKNEAGRLVRNFDFFQYANAAAPRTGFRATYGVLSELASPAEAGFVNGVLAHWGAQTVGQLRDMAVAEWSVNREESLRVAGRLAPLVTAAAEAGLPIAVSVCERGALEIAEGILLLGPFFESASVEVCLGGSCGSSPAIAKVVVATLVSAPGKAYRISEPAFTPVQGAALWALKLAGVELTKETKGRLHEGVTQLNL